MRSICLRTCGIPHSAASYITALGVCRPDAHRQNTQCSCCHNVKPASDPGSQHTDQINFQVLKFWFIYSCHSDKGIEQRALPRRGPTGCGLFWCWCTTATACRPSFEFWSCSSHNELSSTKITQHILAASMPRQE